MPTVPPQQDTRATPPPERPRVLLAEDDGINRMALERYLKNNGYHVTAVTDGAQAVDALAVGGFDLVLMDIQMPVMDGIQATRAIREGQAGSEVREVPIVAMTAYALYGDRESFLGQGMNDYLAKPFILSDLDALLERYASPSLDDA